MTILQILEAHLTPLETLDRFDKSVRSGGDYDYDLVKAALEHFAWVGGRNSWTHPNVDGTKGMWEAATLTLALPSLRVAHGQA